MAVLRGRQAAACRCDLEVRRCLQPVRTLPPQRAARRAPPARPMSTPSDTLWCRRANRLSALKHWSERAMELALTRRSAAEHAVLARKQQAESDQAEMLRLAGLGPADLPLLQTMPEVSDRFGVRRRYCLLAQVCSRVATANRSLDTQPCRSQHADVLHAYPSHAPPTPRSPPIVSPVALADRGGLPSRVLPIAAREAAARVRDVAAALVRP